MFCEFQKISDSEYKCVKCGNIIITTDSIPDNPIIPCFNPLGDILDTKNLKDSVLTQNLNNSNELCSDEEIQKRYSVCSSCDYFTNNSCSQCGCILNRHRVYMNKLAIQDETCPINKW